MADEAFVELTIRMPLQDNEHLPHMKVLSMIGARGLGMFVDGMREQGTATVLRVKSGDGQDKVYPVIDRKERGGLAAVLVPTHEDETICVDRECAVDHEVADRPA